MSAPLRPVAGDSAQLTPPFKSSRACIALGLALLAAGCAGAPPSPYAGADPADPAARVPRAAYRSTIEPYRRQRPVEPADWREQNERITPPPRTGR
jgi:hypothetical protein